MHQLDRHEQRMLDVLHETDCWSGISLLRDAFNKGKWRIAYWSMRSIQRLLNRLEEQKLIESKYEFVPVSGIKVAKLFFRIAGSESEKCCNKLKQIERSLGTPSIGDAVLFCGHLVGEFTFWNVSGGMEFSTPEGAMGRAEWIMTCQECEEASGGNPNLLSIRGNFKWEEKHDDAVSDFLVQERCQKFIADVLGKVPAEYERHLVYVDMDTYDPRMETVQVVVKTEESKGFILKKTGRVEFEEVPIPIQFEVTEEGKIIFEEVD